MLLTSASGQTPMTPIWHPSQRGVTIRLLQRTWKQPEHRPFSLDLTWQGREQEIRTEWPREALELATLFTKASHIDQLLFGADMQEYRARQRVAKVLQIGHARQVQRAW